MRPIASLLLVALVAAATAHAQRGWEVGAFAGGGHYFGDLNKDFNLGDPGLAGMALARYNVSDRWAARLGVSYTRVSAADADSPNIYERARNLSFRSDVIDGNLAMEFNFLPYVHGSREEYFTPYVFAGLTVAKFNPTAELDGERYVLRDLATEGQFAGEEYVNTVLGVGYGLGLKLDLSYEWSLNFEVQARALLTDYLDDVSTVYPDPDEFTNRDNGAVAAALSDRSGEVDVMGAPDFRIGVEGRQRGDANNNDQYGSLTVGLVYYFGQLRCPDVGR